LVWPALLGDDTILA